MTRQNSNNLKIAVVCIAFTIINGCAMHETRTAPDQYRATISPPAPPTSVSMGSIYQAQAGSFIFEDLKAKRVGDILTIMLSEKTSATKKASTSTKKENDVSLGSPSVFGGGVTLNGRNVLGASVDSAQEFTGEGDSEQSNALNGTISVTVAEVYPNGNLFVKGQKRILLNQGDEYIQISGIVRPMDISDNNSIPSTLLADARIVYSGEGAVSDSNKMGWLARFFNSGYWPF